MLDGKTLDAAKSFLSQMREGTATDGDIEQYGVLLEAFAKYVERNAKYRDLWKKRGVKDSHRHMQHKLDRLEVIMQCDSVITEDDLDDAIDIINYAVFFIRNARTARS